MELEKPFKQGSLRAAARRGAVKAAPPATVPIEAAEPPPKPAKAKPPKEATPKTVAAVEDVPHRCGHIAKVEMPAGDSEEKRENRRENVRRSCCPACAAGRRAEKFQGKSLAGRLPHSSTFGPLVYDAEKQEWSGPLAVNGLVFHGRASGLFKLEVQLDRAYRANLAGGAK